MKPGAFWRVVIVLLVVSGLASMTAGSAAADENVPWEIRPAAGVFGADRPNYGYTLNPGEQVNDGVMVVNRGATPLELAVYAADAFTTDAGMHDVANRNEKPTGIGAWVRPARERLTVRPGESVQVPFQLSVPADAAPGDRMGGIVTALTHADPATGNTVDTRLALRIRLRINGKLEPALSIEDMRVDYTGTANPFGAGQAAVSYTIRNTGNAILGGRRSVSVSDLFGNAVSSKEAGSPELLPGETWHASVPVEGVRSGLRLTATATVTPRLADAGNAALPAVTGTARTWTGPWYLPVLLVAFVLVVVVLVRRRRTSLKALR